MGVLENKVAVITGSTRGFGLALAQAYAAEGAALVVSSRSEAASAQAAQKLVEAGARAAGLACDVSNLVSVRALLDFAVQRFGRVDVWVNNAGISPPYGPTAHIQADEFIAATQTNILGTYHGSLTAMRYFLPQRSGKLINILGRGERGPAPMQNAYGSSKAWVRSFTLTLAQEYKGSGVGVFAFSPGMMDTDLLTNVDVIEGFEAGLDRFESVVQALSQPPEDSARQAVWLASAATDGKTGLVARELTPFKVFGRFLKQALNRGLGRKGRPVSIQIHSVPGEFKG